MEFLKIKYTANIANDEPNATTFSKTGEFTGLVIDKGISAEGKFRILVMCIENKKLYNICPSCITVLKVVNSNEEAFFNAVRN